MAKKDKKDKAPEGMKTYKKVGGGSWRPTPNHIIKPGQIFCIDPDMVPDALKDTLQEVGYVKGAVIVEFDKVKPKKVEKEEAPAGPAYEIKKAKDEEGNFVKKGSNFLWNVIAIADGSIVSEEPMGKGKAQKLADSMNS